MPLASFDYQEDVVISQPWIEQEQHVVMHITLEGSLPSNPWIMDHC
jgi:hypothetical protein